MRANYYLIRSLDDKGSKKPLISMSEVLSHIRERDEDESFQEYDVPLRELPDGRLIEGTLFHSVNKTSEPAWLNHAEQMTGAKLKTKRTGARHRACLALTFVEDAGEHIFLISYGSCTSLIDRLPLEPSFGMRVVANAKKTSGFRKVQQTSYRGRRPMSVTEQTATKAGLGEFDIGRRMASVKRVSAELETATPLIAEGGHGFRYLAPVGETDLYAILDAILVWWNEGKFIDPNDRTLDRFEVEKDSYVLKLLEKRFEESIANPNGQFGLDVGDPDLYDATAFAYNPDPIRGRIDWKKLLDLPLLDADWIAQTLKVCFATNPDLDRPRLYAKLDEGAETLIFPLRHLLTLGVDGYIAGASHVFEAGTWMRYRQEWLSETAELYDTFLESSEALLSGLQLEPYTIPSGGIKLNGRVYKGEDAYIANHASTLGKLTITKHHKKYPEWATDLMLEACDLCCDGKYLVFLKKGQGFGQMVDVCGQAKQTAKYLCEVEKFRTWVQDNVIAPSGWTTNLSDRPKLTFVVGVIVDDAAKAAASIGARSKDCLLDFHDTVHRIYGFSAAVKFIDYS